jgi:NADPH2:quinone reductase
MHAIRYHQQGGPEVLQMDELPDPTPSQGEALVAIEASGVNPHEVSRRAGVAGPPLDGPLIPGIEAAGVVVETGAGVTSVRAGDRVIVRQPAYSYAELIAVPQEMLYHIPDALGTVEAATIAIAFTTAWHGLVVQARAQKGETVLVQAAASGVGIAAIQLGKLLGLNVIGTASTAEKLDWAKGYGLDHGINYAETDFVQEARQLTNGQGVDIIVDGVGGEVLTKGIGALTREGRIAVFGGAGGRTVEISLPTLFGGGGKSILGTYGGATTRADFEQILGWLAEGKLRTTVDRTWPLEEAAEAHKYQSSRQIKGKSALIVKKG